MDLGTLQQIINKMKTAILSIVSAFGAAIVLFIYMESNSVWELIDLNKERLALTLQLEKIYTD